MIPTQLLYRLISNVIDVATAIDLEEGVSTSDAAHRERLVDFAERHELDLEDMATLFRVAAGEAAEEPPVTRRVPVEGPGTIVGPQPWT